MADFGIGEAIAAAAALSAGEASAAGGGAAIIGGAGAGAGAAAGGITTAQALGAGAAALSAGSAIYSGVQQNNAGDATAKMYEQQQQQQQLAAAEAEAQKRSELARVLSAQTALRAANGLDVSSPTAAALRANSTEQAMTDIGISRLTSKFQQRQSATAAANAESGGTAALVGGFGSALTSGVKSFSLLKNA